MNSMTFRDVVALGLMTFALFIGAGNIIFPPMIGMQAGSNVWIAAAGFLITAVGLPILTVIALARVGGKMISLSEPIGLVASTVLAVVCYLSVGPLFATPRTATVSYEVGIAPFISAGYGQLALLVYSLVYFAIVLTVSLYPMRLLDIVGNVLSPIKILSLGILGVCAFIFPVGSVGDILPAYQSAPFVQGFSDGYLTMDALGAMVFGIVIVNAIRSRHVTSLQKISYYATIAGLIAGAGLVLVYVSLFQLGHNSYALAPEALNGAAILHAFVDHTFGAKGDFFLAVLISVACLVTAIGLTSACGTYFSSLLGVSYQKTVVGLTLFSWVVSNIGLTKLIAVSSFALTAIYPPCIVLVMLSFIKRMFKNPRLVFSAAIGTSCIFGLLDALKKLDAPLLTWYEQFPLVASKLAWLVPTLIVFTIAMLADRALDKAN